MGRGHATADADGTVTYLPGTGVRGVFDNVTYELSDRTGRRDTAVVGISIGQAGELALAPPAVIPGGPVNLQVDGCGGSEQVAVQLAGALIATGRALDDGGFTTTIQAPDEVGGHRVRADCGTRAFEATMHVAQTQSQSSTGPASVAGAVVVVAGIFSFYLLSGFSLMPHGTAVDRKPRRRWPAKGTARAASGLRPRADPGRRRGRAGT